MTVHAPAAFRALSDTPLPLAVRRRQRRRVVFAVSLFVTALAAIGINEAAHWRRGIDTGLRLDRSVATVASIDPDSPGARADVPLSRRLWAIDDTDIRLDNFSGADGFEGALRVIVDRGGRVFLRSLAGTVVLHFDDDTDPWTCTTPHDVLLRADGPLTLARIEHSPFMTPLLCALGLVVSLLLAGLAGLTVSSSSAVASTFSSQRWRERALVWPAFAITAVVPLWAHVAFFPFVGDVAPAFDYLLIALATTALPHVVLIVLAVNDGARIVIGDVDTRPRWWLLVLTAAVPGLGLVVPFLLVTSIGLTLLWAVRRELRQTADELREATVA